MIGVLTGFLGSIGDRGRRAALLGLTTLGVALLPAAALAADPTTHQYGSSLDQVSPGGVGGAGGAGGGGGTGGGSVTGSLPFTGLDLALLAAVAAALLVAGLMLRRRRVAEAEIDLR